MIDPYQLRRFVVAQDAGDAFSLALAELRAGRKKHHWMWFIFPQIAGLGQSPMARTYAISGLAEARAYLQHAVLGPRLIACTCALAGLPDQTAQDVLGELDAVKLRSSMTLFAYADSSPEPLFQRILDQYFDGAYDVATESRLGPRL